MIYRLNSKRLRIYLASQFACSDELLRLDHGTNFRKNLAKSLASEIRIATNEAPLDAYYY